MSVPGSFDELFGMATGHEPYDYQRRIAEAGLPELLAVPTGTGKTLAAFLPWLWRRRFHPDHAVRASTPHWLVLCLPMRVLTEQAAGVVQRCLDRLGLSDEESAGAAELVPVHVVMGGEGRSSDAWRLHPHRDAVFVGTLDMLLSRALNRGYGASRFAWPIDFGLFNSGCQWIFDETQLMGPALATSRQLAGLRGLLGTVLPQQSTWMSATVDVAAVATIDNPAVRSVVELGPADRTGPLAVRLNAPKRLERLEVGDDEKQRPATIANALVNAHRPGTLTLAVCNTVRLARAIHTAIQRLDSGVPTVLLHSRFRPQDRAAAVQAAVDAEVVPNGPGRIVVSTQVLEAGVDLSAATMFTEAAPWPSIVQRAGRCNRDGAVTGARLLWAPPSKPAPYEPADVEAAVEALVALDGQVVTPTTIREMAVKVLPEVHAVLRRRDLIGLFDTAADLSGNDIDVAPFIRDADDLDVLVAWRHLDDARRPVDERRPLAAELCPAPVGEVRELIKRGRNAFGFDHLAAGRGRGPTMWRRLQPSDVRPGLVVVLDADGGGYSEIGGWDAQSTTAVAPIVTDEAPALVDVEEEVGADPVSLVTKRWLGLTKHLADVEAQVRYLANTLGLDDLGWSAHVEAAAIAGRLHDIGKAHEVFQQTMTATAAVDRGEAPPALGGPWAKSGGSRRARHQRPNFRHELASALALLAEGQVVLEGCADRDLVIYLVAAHHGRVRLGIRSLPGDGASGPDGPLEALGVRDGDVLPAVIVPGGEVPSSTLRLELMLLGRSADGSPSWTERALALRDRPDLGPFRLAFLESLVRLADWRASAFVEIER